MPVAKIYARVSQNTWRSRNFSNNTLAIKNWFDIKRVQKLFSHNTSPIEKN